MAQTDNQRAVDLLFRMRVAQGDTQRTKGEFEKLKKEYNAVAETAVKVNRQFEAVARSRHLDVLASGFGRLEQKAGSTQKALEILAKRLTAIGATDAEIKRVTNSIAAMNAEAERSSGPSGMLKAFRDVQAQSAAQAGGRPFLGARGSTLALAGTELRALPAVNTPLGASTDAFAKILNIFGRMPPVLLGATVAGAALVGVISAIRANALQAEEAIRKQIQAEQEVRKAIAEATSEEVKAKAEEARRNFEFYQAEIKRLQEERSAELARQNVEGELTPQQRFAQGLGFAFGELTGIEKEIQAATENANKYGTELLQLNTAMLDGETAAKDAAAALKRMNDEYFRLAQSDVDRKIAAIVEANQLAASGSSEQLAARLESLRIERQAILDNLEFARQLAEQSGDESQVKQLVERLKDLARIESQLTNGGLAGIIKAREDEEKRIEDLKDRADEYAEAAAKAADAQGDYTQKLNDIATEVLSRIADAARDRDKAFNDAIRDAEADREKVIADFRENANEAEQEALEDRQKVAEDHNKRLIQITREANRDIQTAIEDRDAVAASRAMQAQQDALDEENEGYKDRLRDIDRALAKENQQINKRYVEQLQAVDARLAEQTRRAVERYNEQVQAAILYGNEQRRIAQQNLQRQLSDLHKALSGDLALRNAAYKAMMQGAQVFSDWMLAQAARIRAAATSPAGGNSSAGQGKTKPIPFARGLDAGVAPAFRDILVGEKQAEILRLPRPGVVMTPQQYMRAGGATVNVGAININGSNLPAAQIRAEVVKGLQEFARKAAQ